MGVQTVPGPVKVEIKDQELTDLEPHKKARIGIIGASGSGKTWLAGTAPNPAFIDADHKIRTLKQPAYRQKYGDKRVKFLQVADPFDPKTGIFTQAVGFWQAVDMYNQWNEDEWVETIVIDTMTSFSTLATHVGLEVNSSSGKSKTLLNARPEKGSQVKPRNVLLLTEADYGAEMNVLDQFMDQAIQSDKHLIVLFHDRAEYADSGGIKSIGPQVTGRRTRATFGRWFDEVWSLRVDGNGDKAKRVLYTQTDNLYSCLKTTLGMPPKIIEPNLTDILKQIEMTQASLNNK